MALKLGSNDTAILAGSSVVKQILLGSSPKFAAPVLDHVPGAAAAYSLRRLSNAYSGPVVKVRRSSDSSTADFTAAEVVDGTLEAWVGAGDGFVHTWYDQSGNERNATQATDGYQPKLVNSGSLVTEGGKPSMLFDGANDRLLFDSITSLSPWTVIEVKKRTSAGVKGVTVGYAGGSSGTYTAWEYSDNDTYVSNRAGYRRFLGAFQQQSVCVSLSASDVASDLHLWRDGSQQSVVSTNALAHSNDITVLGSANTNSYGAGSYSELIIYPSDVSASRELAEGEIAWHYGLQSKLPYDHAYAPQAIGGGSQTVPTDSDVLAFAAASGATSITDLNKIEDLVTYLKAQGLWDYARFYPMKSSQNAGTGSTVYGLGGLTTNNMTLVNSPTWGSDGVAFDAASSQYGTASDFLTDASISLWIRGFFDYAPVGVLIAQYGGVGNQRSVQIYSDANTLRMSRSSDGVAGDTYSNGATPSSDSVVVAEWIDGGGMFVWKDKESQSVTLTSGPSRTTRFDSTADVTIMSQPNGAAPMSGTVVLAGFIETALTTTQRETITDIINAL